ncbi:MAG: co-chaperone GroES [Planctomycetes bacterium]|nr:co-chaperone GroES [Planctomycetota bacterium]
MKLKPLDNRVVIEPVDAEDKTSGGIFLPDNAQEKPQIGKVVAAGPGALQDAGKRTAMSVKKGDEVVYGKYMGNDIEVGSKKYVILRETDLLGIVER